MKKSKLLIPLVSAAFVFSCASEDLKNPTQLAEDTYKTVLNLCSDLNTVGVTCNIESGKVDITKNETYPSRYEEVSSIKLDSIKGNVKSKHANLSNYSEEKGNDDYKAIDELSNFDSKGSFTYKQTYSDKSKGSDKDFNVPLNIKFDKLNFYTSNSYKYYEENTTYGAYLNFSEGGNDLKNSFDDLNKNLKLTGYEHEDAIKTAVSTITSGLTGDYKKTVIYSVILDFIKNNVGRSSKELKDAKEYIAKDDFAKPFKEELTTVFKTVFATKSDKITAKKDGNNYIYTVSFTTDEVSTFLKDSEIIKDLGIADFKLDSGTISSTITTSSDCHLVSFALNVASLKANEIKFSRKDKDTGTTISDVLKINEVSIKFAISLDRSVDVTSITNEVNTATSATDWKALAVL